MSAATAAAVPTTRIDLAGAEMSADPWPQLRALREQGAVVWHETLGRWLVTTDREVRRLLVKFDRFTVEGTTVEDLFGADAFIAMDDRRRHDALRNVWADAFRKQGLDALRPRVERIVEALLAPVVERLQAGETVDLASAFCRALPTRVIAAMMGVPDSAIPDIVRWSDAMAAGGGTYLDEEAARIVRAAREDAKAALAGYLGDLLRERRARPGDDLISQLAASEPGRHLPDDQLLPNIRQLLFAGNETTAKWLAQIFVAYGERPDDWRALQRDRALVVPANDEVMRWAPPVGTLVRRVRGGAVEVGGVTLGDGDHVTLLPSAANRDPDRYADPDRLDIRRPYQPNLGFGVGFHNCLGLALAKMEGEVAIGGLLDRVAAFRVAGPYAHSSLPLRGPLEVPVALDA